MVSGGRVFLAEGTGSMTGMFLVFLGKSKEASLARTSKQWEGVQEGTAEGLRAA